MANKVILKHNSSQTSAVAKPTVVQLEVGELALDQFSGKLYMKQLAAVPPIPGTPPLPAIVEIGGGSGDVTGPGSVTDEAVPVFDGTTGKLLKESAVTLTSTRTIGGSVTAAALMMGNVSMNWLSAGATPGKMNLSLGQTTTDRIYISGSIGTGINIGEDQIGKTSVSLQIGNFSYPEHRFRGGVVTVPYLSFYPGTAGTAQPTDVNPSFGGTNEPSDRPGYVYFNTDDNRLRIYKGSGGGPGAQQWKDLADIPPATAAVYIAGPPPDTVSVPAIDDVSGAVTFPTLPNIPASISDITTSTNAKSLVTKEFVQSVAIGGTTYKGAIDPTGWTPPPTPPPANGDFYVAEKPGTTATTPPLTVTTGDNIIYDGVKWSVIAKPADVAADNIFYNPKGAITSGTEGQTYYQQGRGLMVYDGGQWVDLDHLTTSSLITWVADPGGITSSSTFKQGQIVLYNNVLYAAISDVSAGGRPPDFATGKWNAILGDTGLSYIPGKGYMLYRLTQTGRGNVGLDAVDMTFLDTQGGITQPRDFGSGPTPIGSQGRYATSIGVNNSAVGLGSFAANIGNRASHSSAAFGEGNNANAASAFAIGKGNSTSATASFIGGWNHDYKSDGSGLDHSVSGIAAFSFQSILNQNAVVLGDFSAVLGGQENHTSGIGSVVLGGKHQVAIQPNMVYVSGNKYKGYTTAEINALSFPEEGTIVYNTDQTQLYQYDGTAWSAAGGLEKYSTGRAVIWKKYPAASTGVTAITVPIKDNIRFDPKITTPTLIVGDIIRIKDDGTGTTTATLELISEAYANTLYTFVVLDGTVPASISNDFERKEYAAAIGPYFRLSGTTRVATGINSVNLTTGETPSQPNMVYVSGIKYQSYTTVDIQALPSPEAGTVVYDANKKKLQIHDGSKWDNLGGQDPGPGISDLPALTPTPTRAEFVAMSDKVNEILGALRTAGVITGASIADLPPLTATPVKSEYDLITTTVNDIITALETANIITP